VWEIVWTFAFPSSEISAAALLPHIIRRL